MHKYIKVLTLFFLGICMNVDAQKYKLPKIFQKKKGSTQWYGDPVSQRKLKNNYNIYSTVGLGGGTSNYYGEMTSYKYPIATILKTTRWNFSTNYTKHYSYRFAARIGFSYARIAGDDKNFENAAGAYLAKYSRGLHFRNDLKEFSLVGIYDFTRYRKGGYTLRPKVTPYAFLGVSLANHNPRARGEAVNGVVDKDWLKLREFDTEGQVAELDGKQYSTIAFAIPFGAGIRYKIHDQFDISLEGGLRYTFSRGGKYLDDVSENYILNSDINPNPSNAEKFSYRANELYWARTGELRDQTKITKPATLPLPESDKFNRGNGRQDWYFLTMISLNYYIPSQIKCRPNNNNK
jgi:hypothetical protein